MAGRSKKVISQNVRIEWKSAANNPSMDNTGSDSSMDTEGDASALESDSSDSEADINVPQYLDSSKVVNEWRVARSRLQI